MARQEHKQPWWERPATLPGEPHYEPEREHLRAELARARHADLTSRPACETDAWEGRGASAANGVGSDRVAA